MSRYRKRSIDANHTEIVNELRSRGVYCYDLSSSGGGVPDIITFKNGHTVLIEIKTERDAQVKKTQLGWIAGWPGYVGFAQTADEAYRLATEPERYALTRQQKDKLAGLFLTCTKAHMHYPTVAKELEKL